MPATRRAQGARRRSKPARAAAISSSRCSRAVARSATPDGLAGSRPDPSADGRRARPCSTTAPGAHDRARAVGVCGQRPRARCRIIRWATLDHSPRTTGFASRPVALSLWPRATARDDLASAQVESAPSRWMRVRPGSRLDVCGRLPFVIALAVAISVKTPPLTGQRCSRWSWSDPERQAQVCERDVDFCFARSTHW